MKNTKLHLFLVFLFSLTALNSVMAEKKGNTQKKSEAIYWPFMGCADRNDFVNKHDSLCVLLNNSMNKKQVLTSDEEIKRVARAFESETDSVVLFFNSNGKFSYASLYGRYNRFVGLKYDILRKMAQTQHNVTDKKQIAQLIDMAKGGSEGGKVSYFDQLRELQSYKKVVVLRKKSPLRKPLKNAWDAYKNDPQMSQCSSIIYQTSSIFSPGDDPTNHYNMYMK